jgi:hypothetical protein
VVPYIYPHGHATPPKRERVFPFVKTFEIKDCTNNTGGKTLGIKINIPVSLSYLHSQKLVKGLGEGEVDNQVHHTGTALENGE